MAKAKFTVKAAKEFLAQFPDDADVRGFGQVKVVPKAVAVKPAVQALAPQE
jgi:hypothetical protein